jgi:hypothetical protein
MMFRAHSWAKGAIALVFQPPALFDMEEGNATWSPFIQAKNVLCSLDGDRDRPTWRECVEDPIVTIVQREIITVEDIDGCDRHCATPTTLGLRV